MGNKLKTFTKHSHSQSINTFKYKFRYSSKTVSFTSGVHVCKAFFILYRGIPYVRLQYLSSTAAS